MVYRVEFTNTLTPEAAPSADRSAGRRQRAALAAHRRHRDHEGHAHRRSDDDDEAMDDDDDDASSSAGISPVLPNNHGPQTDRLVYGLGPFQGYDSGDPTSREVGLYDQPFVDTFIHPLVERRADHRRPVRRSLSARREGHLRSRQPGLERSRRHPRRAPAAGEGRVHRLQRLLDRARGPDRATSSRTASRTTAQLQAELDRQPAPRLVEHQPPARRRPSMPSNIITGLKGSGDCVQVGRNALPLFNAGLVGTQRQTLYLRTQPDAATSPTSAPTSCSRCWCATPRRSASTRRWASRPAPVATLKGPRARHHQRHQPGPADPGRRRLHRRRHHARRRHRLELPERPPPGRRHRAEPQSGEREQRADQPDRRGRPGRRPGQGRRGQRQGLSRPLPVPGAGPPGSVPGTRRHQRSDGADAAASRWRVLLNRGASPRRTPQRRRSRTAASPARVSCAMGWWRTPCPAPLRRGAPAARQGFRRAVSAKAARDWGL